MCKLLLGSVCFLLSKAHDGITEVLAVGFKSKLKSLHWAPK